MEKTIKLQIIEENDKVIPLQFEVLKQLSVINKTNSTIQNTVLLDGDEHVWMLEVTTSLVSGGTFSLLYDFDGNEYGVEIVEAFDIETP